MKRILLAALLLLPALAYSQVTLVNCAPSTPCNSSTGPSNTGSGDPAWKAFGEINGNFNLLPSQLFSGQPLPVVNGGNGTATPSLVGGTNVTIGGTWPNQTITASSTAATSFSALTGATNTTAAMLVGTGASIAPTGSGAITANAFNGVLGTANGGTNSTSLAGAGIPVFSGTITAGHCVEWLNATTVEDAGAACGTGGGGTGAFSGLTGGTNTIAAMLVGTGASFGPTGSGTVQANSLSAGIALGTPGSGNLVNASGLPLSSGVTGTLPAGNFPALNGDVTNSAGSLNTTVGKVNGAAIPVSAAVLGSNSSSQLTALTLGGNLSATGGVLQTSQTINPQTGTSYTFLSTDAGKLVTASNVSAQAYTLPQAGTTGFTAGYSFDFQNKGAGTVTVTPTTSTINGSSTLTIATNLGCTATSDGTNYQVSACSAVAPGASSAFSGIASGTNTTATMTLGSGGTLTFSGTGTVNANQVNGATVPASAGMTTTNASNQVVAQTVQTSTLSSGATNDFSVGTGVAVLYATPASGGSTLNGITAGNTLQQLYIVNAEAAGGSDLIKLTNQSASDTTAANRFLTSATTSLAIPPGGRVLCVYLPSAVSRWSCQ